jgi:hypothetical protein
LLVTDPDNPRSLGWVAQTLRSRLRRMGSLADGATLSLAEGVPDLIGLTTESLWPLEAHNKPQAQDKHTPAPLQTTLALCETTARLVSDRLCGLFFTHSGEARYSMSS